MKDEDFEGLAAGLEDAIAFLQSDATKGRVAAGPAYPREIGDSRHWFLRTSDGRIRP